MIKRRWRSAFGGAALFCAATALGQIALPPDLNFFNDDLPLKIPRGPDGTRIYPSEKPKAAPENAQLLVFQDGRQIHGKVTEITPNEVVWQRADVSAALRFPRAAVRRIFVDPSAKGQESNGNFPFSNDESSPAQPSGKPLPVTLKLPGGDWLFGTVTSSDGQTFALRLDDGTALSVPRAQLEWLHFGLMPAPAFGLSGSSMDLGGWLPASANLEVVDGTMTVRDTSWIGRAMAPPKRFEVAVDLPPGAEAGTGLWLQPFGPQVNCYSFGTVKITLGKKEITRVMYANKFENVTSPMPPEAADDKGPVSYRFLYDGPGQRMVVLRNGKNIGDWSFAPKKEDAANMRQMQDRDINGVCLERNGAGSPLKFNRLRIQPWNGVVPAPGDTADTTDQLTKRTGEPIHGKLESIADTTLLFSGGSHAREEGMDVRFANTPTALAAPEARLELGKQGEFGARGLEMRDGKLHCETAFARAVEIPAKALQSISFPPHPAAPQEPADILVFKNGDELPGHALSAISEGPLRWKTASGQELDIQPDRIAGLRFAPASEAKPSEPAATAELRTGECLRGNLVALDEKQVQIEHGTLGTLSLDRSRLWHLFPSPAADVIDGGRDAETWLRAPVAQRRTPSRGKATETAPWTYLDGTYILRGGGSRSFGNSEEWAGLQRELGSGLERFEVRFEAAAPWAMSTHVLLQLSSKTGTAFHATISYNYVQLVTYSARANNRPNWRDVQLQEKLPDMDARRAVRLFVDTKAGTCDLCVNGAVIARVGQDPNERLPKAKYTVRIQPYANDMPGTLSHLWIGPWNGELPRLGGTSEAATLLSNGDAAPGVPKEMRDGKMIMDGELGGLEIPVERVQQLDFGGALSPEKAAAHVRLTDGTVANVERFRWDGHEFTAHSATFGDLRLPASAVSEIVYQPLAPHTPMTPTPKKVAQADGAKDGLELRR